MRSFSNSQDGGAFRGLDLARVLIVHGELAPRLALQTILQAGGYTVDVATTPAEALAKLDRSCYELVLSDALLSSGSEALDLLAYARVKDYQPATALIFADDFTEQISPKDAQRVAVQTENIPGLLGKVADLIGMRARRRARPLNQLTKAVQ